MTPTEKRNYFLGVVNGALFALADTLLDPTLVLVSFVSALTSSPLVIGLIVPLRNAGWFLPQLYVSTFLQSWPYKKRLYALMAVVRATGWGLLALAVATVGSPALLLAAFIGLFTINELASGFSGLAFMSVMAKTIPAQRRAEFYALRLTLGGLLGIGGGFLVRAILAQGSPLAFPDNYLLLLALAFACAILGLLVYLQTREPPDADVPPGTSLRAQVRKGRRVLITDQTYQAFLKLRIALMLAGAATPFFFVWAKSRFGLPLEWVGLYLAIGTAARLVTNVLFGYLSRRGASNHALITVAALAGLLMVVLILALLGFGVSAPVGASVAGFWLVPVFALSGVREAGIGVAAASLLLDLAPALRRPLYVGLTHSVLGLTLLTTAAGGLVVSLGGHGTLFGLALVANLLALRYAYAMRHPRRERHLIA